MSLPLTSPLHTIKKEEPSLSLTPPSIAVKKEMPSTPPLPPTPPVIVKKENIENIRLEHRRKLKALLHYIAKQKRAFTLQTIRQRPRVRYQPNRSCRHTGSYKY